MKYTNIDFNSKTILITGGAGFIGSNLALYFQKKFPKSQIVVFDCFRSGEKFSNGNLKSFGHFTNLVGFEGDLICGNINSKEDLEKLNFYITGQWNKIQVSFKLENVLNKQVEILPGYDNEGREMYLTIQYNW